MKLSKTVELFIGHFGEMGRSWGINRTVGQIYALLYMAPQPLSADDIMDAIGCSRSNVSMGLKELQSWRLVRLQHLPGGRREYFSPAGDIWQMARTIAEERRRREIDPTAAVLQALLKEPGEDRHTQARLAEMSALLALLTSWSDDIQRLSNDDLAQLLKLGSRVMRLLELKNRVPFLGGKEEESTPFL